MGMFVVNNLPVVVSGSEVVVVDAIVVVPSLVVVVSPVLEVSVDNVHVPLELSSDAVVAALVVAVVVLVPLPICAVVETLSG